MIHPLDNPGRRNWHKWFAWRPVHLQDDRWEWLTVVDRRLAGSTNWEGDDWGYIYRPQTKKSKPIDVLRDLPIPLGLLFLFIWVMS